MKHLQRIAVLLCFVLVAVALIVPETKLDQMEEKFIWLAVGMKWLKTAVPGWDMDHLVAFALLGWTTRLAFPRVRPFHLLAGLCAFAALTELAQVWVPGRTASAADATLDVVGGLLGYVVARATGWVARAAPAPALPWSERE